MGDLKLIGIRVSPLVNRVQFALNLKSIEYEFLKEEFFPKSQLLLKSNPVHKKIPILIHNDKPICESLVIVEYIDELWTSGPSILPSDPYDRAIARFWAAYIDNEIISSLRGLRTVKDEDEKMKARNRIVDALILLEGAFIECSKGKGFFGGDKIGYLDLALGCFLHWIKAAEIIKDVKLLEETKIPNLVKWGERFCLDDAVKDVIPGVEEQELLEYYKYLTKMLQVQSIN